MKIQCPSCDQRLEIPEELAGQTIECPACNASLAVPSLATPPPSPVQVQQSAPQVTASEKPKSSIPKWAIASVAGIAVLVVCLIMFFPNDPNGVSSSEPTAVKTDGESQQSTTAAVAKPIERVAGAKAPDISIHIAARKGNIEAVKQHLVAGTNIGKRGKNNLTPLHHAADKGQLSVAKLLIENGASVNADGYFQEDSPHRISPLGLAAGRENEEMVKLLLNNGAKIRSHELIGLMSTKNVIIVELLVSAGINFNVNGINDREGDTPLRWAIRYKADNIAKLLIKNGVNINTNIGGSTLLHDSATAGSVSMIRVLIDEGLNVNAQNDRNRTPLDSAMGYAKGPLAIPEEQNLKIKLLRKHGAKTAEELKAEGK